MMLPRREFFILLGSGFVGATLPAVAQRAKPPTVALVFGGNDISELLGPDPSSPPVRAFVHEMRDLGWSEGRTIVIERRTLEGSPDRAWAVLTELIAHGVDVIVLGGARWLHDAALNATRTVPIVTLFQDDPVASGLITQA